jgi:hypothetical protein
MMATILGYFTMTAATSVLGTVWKGLCDFISTPVGAALIAGLVMFGVGDLHGHRASDKSWQVKWSSAEATAEKARVQRDADIKVKVEADANQRLAVLAARKAQLEQQVQAYEDDQAKQAAVGNFAKGSCTCTTDSSDARWLRDAQRGATKPKAQRGFALRLRTIGR